MSVCQIDSTAELRREIVELGRQVSRLEYQSVILTRVLLVIAGSIIGALPSVIIALAK